MTDRTKATLLFTSYFSKSVDKINKPLSLTEWNKFVRWQQSKNLNPEAFLNNDADAILSEWNDQVISRNRLLGLLERKAALGIALDKWSRAGVWIINRGDLDYPQKIKEQLRNHAPNIFFGIGNKELLQQQYAGVVGSRAADELDLERSTLIGQRMVQQQYGIVSGGAKGVDETAMLGALNNGGKSVGILADSLIKKSTSSLYRKYIISGQLALISPYNPEAGFNAGNAMSRNKLIYSMSDFSIVVKSDTKGGTWEGARENLKNEWVPLWVCESPEKGNIEIVKLGASLITDPSNLSVETLKTAIKDSTQVVLFEKKQDTVTVLEKARPNITNENGGLSKNGFPIGNDQTGSEFYQLFLSKWYRMFQSTPVTKKVLSDKLRLIPSQVEAWLEQARKRESVVVKNKSDEEWYSLSNENKPGLS